MKRMDVKKVLVGLALGSIVYVMIPSGAYAQAKTQGQAGQKEVRLTGKAAFNDADDGNRYKNKDWTSKGIVISCTLSKDRKKVTDVTIEVDFQMNLGGLTVSNSKRISCPDTIPVTDKKLSAHIDNEDCICDLQLNVENDSANGTVDFTYKYELGDNKFDTRFGNDPLSLKKETE
jgi:hypothetical protein